MLFLIYERLGLAKDVGGAQEVNFTVNGGQALANIEADDLRALGLSENQRRLAPCGPRPLSPAFAPHLARLALSLMRLKSRRAAERR